MGFISGSPGGQTINAVPLVTSGQVVAATSASIAAGGQATLNSNQITSGKTGKLVELVVTASAPLKIVLQTVLDGTATNKFIWITDIRGWDWVSPARNLVTVTESASAGFDGFRAVITNLDISEAVDVYATFAYDEET